VGRVGGNVIGPIPGQIAYASLGETVISGAEGVGDGGDAPWFGAIRYPTARPTRRHMTATSGMSGGTGSPRPTAVGRSGVRAGISG
jgi:hypothetical protein